MRITDKHWLAGILEGEGSFCAPPPSLPSGIAIQMVSTDEDIISRVASLLECSYFEISEARRIDNPHWKRSWSAQLRGRRAKDMMVILKPLMGQRRQLQIDKAIAKYESRPGRRYKLTEAKVKSIIELCRQGHKQKDIAKQFEISREAVNKISRGKYAKWKHLV